MTSSPAPSSFYLEKDQFSYTDLVSLQMEDSRTDHKTFSTLKRRLRNKLRAITASWPKSFTPSSITLAKNWHLGLTAFGGPPVQFQMLHEKFVVKEGWIDEQLVSISFLGFFIVFLFQEIFAISQALPGSASTKMLVCINYIHSGLFAGIGSFLLWSLPGAIGMFGLSLGVSRIGDTLPLPIYGLLSGLNSATVGIIALAAMQLAQMAVTDKLTRALVFFGGAGGMLYTALWYFPVLMVAAGGVTVMADFRLLPRLYAFVLRKQRPTVKQSHRKSAPEIQAELDTIRSLTDDDLQRFIYTRGVYIGDIEAARDPLEDGQDALTVNGSVIELNVLTWKVGTLIISLFTLSFITVMILRAFISKPPRALALFQNLYLAGTIIFGGGPVAIPLLKEYIVAEGWVSQRDFLIGLALIQAFPGPNFNFAVYLGALATVGTSVPSIVGAFVAYLAIFLPGLLIVTGIMGLWKVLRSKAWLRSFLRGINAGAVGLVFTAVYKLWQIGEVEPAHPGGQPLGTDAWWVAVTAAAFVGGCWFKIRAPIAILFGGFLGLGWYGVVRHW